jgi:hypothetical protein
MPGFGWACCAQAHPETSKTLRNVATITSAEEAFIRILLPVWAVSDDR